MPVVLDVDKELEVRERNLETGVPLSLEGQTDVVLTKFISMNPRRACWQPEGVWWEQVTSDVGGGRRRVRIAVKMPDGSTRAVNVDDGLIIDLEGKMSRIVGLLPGRPPMNEAEVDAYVDQTDKQVPLYQQWDFRVVQVKKTNGPEERTKLHRSEDQKRLAAQGDMYQAIAQAFRLGSAQMQGQGWMNHSAQAALDAGMQKAEELVRTEGAEPAVDAPRLFRGVLGDSEGKA